MDERLRLLLGPDRDDLTCEECFAALPWYVELDRVRGERAARVRAHLDGCPACREEYEVLLELVRTDSGR